LTFFSKALALRENAAPFSLDFIARGMTGHYILCPVNNVPQKT
jgi:hypothetical protein